MLAHARPHARHGLTSVHVQIPVDARAHPLGRAVGYPNGRAPILLCASSRMLISKASARPQPCARAPSYSCVRYVCPALLARPGHQHSLAGARCAVLLVSVRQVSGVNLLVCMRVPAQLHLVNTRLANIARVF
jgi:hypothetical protein